MALQDKFDSAFTDKLLKKALMSPGKTPTTTANDNNYELTKSNLVTLSNSFTSLQNAFNKIYAQTLNVRNLHQYDEKRMSNISRQNSLETKIAPGGSAPVQAMGGPGDSLASTAATLDSLASSVEKLNDKMKKINLSGSGYSNSRLLGNGVDLAGDAVSTRSRSRMARMGGRALGVAGVGLDVYGRYQEGQTAGQIGAGVGGGMAGAALGAKGGAAAGAAIGAFFFGAGAVPGAAIGGFLGGVGGYFAGSTAGDTAYNALNTRATGGGVKAGGSYVIGERGPEVLMLGGLSGKVIANGQRGRVSQSEKNLNTAADKSSRAAAKVIKGQPPGPTSYSSKFSNYLGSLFGNMPNWLNRIKEYLGVGADSGDLGGDYFGGEYSELLASEVAGSDRGGGSTDWRTDTDFLAAVNRVAHEYNFDPRSLLGLIASESGFDPNIENQSQAPGERAYGLFQFMPRWNRSNMDRIRRMNRAQQVQFAADTYFKNANLPTGATAGQLYATIFAPSIAKRINYDRNTPLYREGTDGYKGNASRDPSSPLYPGLDLNSDGAITIADLDARIVNKVRSYRLPGMRAGRSAAGFISPVRGGRPGSGFRTAERPGHEGIDIPIDSNSPVYSVKAGEVIAARPMRGYGNVIIIRHDDGVTTRYGHLREIIKTSGRVRQGEIIARSGGGAGDPGAGRSTGSHLHFEVRLPNGTPVDPRPYIPSLSASTNSATPESATTTRSVPLPALPSGYVDYGTTIRLPSGGYIPASARSSADVPGYMVASRPAQQEMDIYFQIRRRQ